MTADPISASNTNPTFDQGSSITRSVPENSPADTSVGAAVMATDDEGGLVYRLGGPDGGSFGINTDGEIKTKSGITYNYESAKNTYSVTVSVHDRKDIASAPDTTIDDSIDVAISLTDANDAPTITSGDMTRTISENTTAVAAYMASDEDPSDTLSWSVENNADADAGNLFQINSAGELSFKIAPDFEDEPDVGEDNTYNVTVQATDGGGLFATLDVAVSVTNVNEAPTIDNGPSDGGTINTDENTSTTVTIATYEASDVDAGTNLMWTLEGDDVGDFTITKDPNTGNGMLRFSNVPNFESADDDDVHNDYEVTVKVSDGSFSVARTLTVNVENVNDAPTITSGDMTRTISENSTAVAAYSVSDEDPSDTLSWSVENNADADAGNLFQINSAGELSFKIAPDFEDEPDVGEDNTYNVTVQATDGGGLFATLDVAVSVTNVNEAPTIDNGPSDGGTINTDENTSTTVTIATYEASDVDAGTNLMWTLEGDDVGDFTITKDPNTGNGMLRFRNVPNFESADDDDVHNDYEVTVKVSDGSFSVTRTLTVNVENVNEAPTITSDDMTRTIAENTTAVAAYMASDEDPSDTLSWSVENNADADDGNLFQINSAGELSFKIAPDFEDKQDVGKDNTYNLTVQATAVGGLYATRDVAVSVTNVNEAPTIDNGPSDGGTINTDENTSTTVTIATYEASDVDAGTNLMWTLEGDDEGGFTITKDLNTGNGVLRFSNVPNFEMPTDVGDTPGDNTYVVKVKVSDGSFSVTRTLTVNVENVNERPTITSGDMTRTIAENTTVVGAYTASDVDAGHTLTLMWDVETADDPELFQINSSSGELSFKSAPDFEDKQDAGTNNVYNVTVIVTDAGGLSATRRVAVTVTNVNEAPVFADDSTTGFIVNENLPASTALELFTATDQDAGTDLMWSLEGSDADQFRITENGQGRGVPKFLTSPNYEAPTDSDKDNVYKITLKVRDNHMPQMQPMLAVTVEVQDVNERPVISGSSTADFMEIEFDVDDADLTAMDFLVASFSAYDDDGDDVSWSLGTSEDKAHFVITKNADGEGVLSFAIRPDYENPVDMGSNNVYRVVIRADDGQNESNSVGTFTVTVNVTPVDETPEITTTGPTHATPSFAEIEYDATTAELSVADYEAHDEEGETITWSLGGTDSGDFTIDPTSGLLSFARRPNFEMPVDGSTPPDNMYDIIVKATDASPTRNIREYPVAVAVTNVDETPEVDGPSDDIDVLETPYNSFDTPEVATFLARDEEKQDITWDLSGDDAGDFIITKDAFFRVGIVTFKTPPNFEVPDDEDSSNTYEFTVEATDTASPTTNTGAWDYTVAVTDVNERPEFTGTPETSFTLDEHDANEVYTTPPLASYAARDEEGVVTWSLAGTDGGDFAIDGAGAVTFAATPSFETPTDSDRDNIYEFKVVATDVLSRSPRLTATVDVRVTVEDIEEAGTIDVSNLHPAVGDVITFVLMDPDGGIDLSRQGGFSWRIERRLLGEAWQTIPISTPDSTTTSYTVAEDYADHEIRAAVRYTDRRGPLKTAESMETAAVTADPIINAPPRFRTGGTQRIAEVGAGVDVGERLTASDRENDSITWGISGGRGASFFEIDASSGQLRTIEALDFETTVVPNPFILQVTLHDGRDADGNPDSSVDVTTAIEFEIIDVEELGVVTLSPDEPEVGDTVVATFEDGDGSVSDVSWQWARSENGRTSWVNISRATSSSYTTLQIRRGLIPARPGHLCGQPRGRQDRGGGDRKRRLQRKRGRHLPILGRRPAHRAGKYACRRELRHARGRRGPRG